MIALIASVEFQTTVDEIWNTTGDAPTELAGEGYTRLVGFQVEEVSVKTAVALRPARLGGPECPCWDERKAEAGISGT